VQRARRVTARRWSRVLGGWAADADANASTANAALVAGAGNWRRNRSKTERRRHGEQRAYSVPGALRTARRLVGSICCISTRVASSLLGMLACCCCWRYRWRWRWRSQNKCAPKIARPVANHMQTPPPITAVNARLGAQLLHCRFVNPD
jgi:hypothetical protein